MKPTFIRWFTIPVFHKALPHRNGTTRFSRWGEFTLFEYGKYQSFTEKICGIARFKQFMAENYLKKSLLLNEIDSF